MDADLRKRARLRCMHLLERRDYTEKQLRDKLRLGKTDYPQEIIDDALAYVKSYRYVDDARYARQYVESVKERKSRRQITQELYRKGVARDLVEAAFEETEQIPEEELIRFWMEKRRYCPETADLKEKRRMYAFLMRKGFSTAHVSSMMRME